MRPTASTTVSRPFLGQVAYEYLLNQAEYIGLQVMPIFEAPDKSDEYGVIPIEALLKMGNVRRAPDGTYNRSDWKFEMANFSCLEYGHEEPLDDVDRKNYARLIDAETTTVQIATDILLRAQEKRIADKVFSTGNITNTGAVSIEWSTAATCTPKNDVQDAISTLRAATGIRPDTLVISEKVFRNLLLCSALNTARVYTNPIDSLPEAAQISALAMYLGVNRILIGRAQYDSAKKNKTYSLADIWDDEYALVAKLSAGGPNLREPSLGRTFLWTTDSPSNVVVETYREENKRADIYRVRHYTDECFVFTGAGYLLSNITA